MPETTVDKDDFIISNINNKEFIQELLESHKKYAKHLKEYSNNQPEHCKNCEATVCYQCPIVSYNQGENETDEFFSKFHSTKIDLCEVYKLFGKISQVVQKIK